MVNCQRFWICVMLHSAAENRKRDWSRARRVSPSNFIYFSDFHYVFTGLRFTVVRFIHDSLRVTIKLQLELRFNIFFN